MTLMRGLDYRWPGFLGSMFDVFSFASGGMSSVVSQQCLYPHASMEPAYLNVLVTALAPLFFALGACCVLAALYCTSKSEENTWERLNRRLLMVTILIVFLLQPSVGDSDP